MKVACALQRTSSLTSHACISNSHTQDVENFSWNVFPHLLTWTTRCTALLHQTLPSGEILQNYSVQIWGAQSLCQETEARPLVNRLGLTHDGAHLMMDSISSEPKVASSFPHRCYNSWMHPSFRFEWEINAAWASSRGPNGQLWQQIPPPNLKKNWRRSLHF